jgi:hypothetical protein
MVRLVAVAGPEVASASSGGEAVAVQPRRLGIRRKVGAS